MMKVEIKDGYWNPRIEKLCCDIIPYQYRVLNDEIKDIPISHAIENFRIAAGVSKGIYQGMVFQDSDVAKWIEAAAYSLRHYPNRELEQKIDSLVELIEKVQQDDGYLNTCYICTGKEHFTNIAHGHELYCAGHLLEAAVAYARVTGKERFLHVMEKYIFLLMNTIGAEEEKLHIYPGHPELELALYKLYKYTEKKEYLDFMEYLISERGTQPSFLEIDEGFGEQYKDKWFALPYHQAHKPVWEQQEAVGHCVRALYLYCAMADLANETDQSYMKNTLTALWKDITEKKMYITGALGAEAHGEAFSVPYDLPNDRAYAETCASIALIFLAKRMCSLEKDSVYADVMERALYNCVLSGMSADGKNYFYVNPLEVRTEETEARFDLQHVKSRRVPWFGCACCPPNIARLMASLEEYIYDYDEKRKCLYVFLYIGGNVSIQENREEILIGRQNNKPEGYDEAGFGYDVYSDYLNSGRIRFKYKGKQQKTSLCLRIPEWAKEWKLFVNQEECHCFSVQKGFVYVEREYREGDCVEILFPIKLKKVYANPKVSADTGKVALMRGPVVYCLEEADNGPFLNAIRLGPVDTMMVFNDKELPYDELAVILEGEREELDGWEGKLYRQEKCSFVRVKVKAVPYHSWGNRKPGEMLVWIGDGET